MLVAFQGCSHIYWRTECTYTPFCISLSSLQCITYLAQEVSDSFWFTPHSRFSTMCPLITLNTMACLEKRMSKTFTKVSIWWSHGIHHLQHISSEPKDILITMLMCIDHSNFFANMKLHQHSQCASVIWVSSTNVRRSGTWSWTLEWKQLKIQKEEFQILINGMKDRPYLMMMWKDI